MEIVLKAILFVSSAPTALGLQRLPSSLENSPEPFGQAAASTLALGCALSLLGILRRDRDKGLPVQRAGLILVAVGGLLYALALGVSVDLFALLWYREWGMAWHAFALIAIAFGMSLGIGAGAVARRRQLGHYVHRRTVEADEDRAAG